MKNATVKSSAAKSAKLAPSRLEKKAPAQGQYAPRSCSRFVYCV